MRVNTATELGHLVRDKRKQQNLTQAQLANKIGVSRKWLIDLESGKATAEVSLVLRTLRSLGIEMEVKDRTSRVVTDRTFNIDDIVDATRKRR